MIPDANTEDAKIKKGDLVKWRACSSYGIVMDDSYSQMIQVFWFAEFSGPEKTTWEQRMNVELINES
jgi:hypothetical protein